MPESDLLTREQAAEYLNTTERHIRKLWERRELGAVKVGGKVLHSKAQLDRYIEDHSIEAVR